MAKAINYRCLAYFLLGFIFGSIFIHATAAKQIEDMYWEKEELKVQLYETHQRLSKLEAENVPSLETTVKDIKLELTAEGKEFSYPPLKQHLYEIAEDLLGQKITALHHRFLLKIFDNRIVSLENQHYVIEVEAVIIGEIITFFMEISTYDTFNNVS